MIRRHIRFLLFGIILWSIHVGDIIISAMNDCHEVTSQLDKYLEVSPLLSFHATRWDECMLKCMYKSDCQSINYFSVNQTCGLLSKNQLGNKNLLMNRTGAVYATNPLHPCNKHDSPCSGSGTCITNESSAVGFSCFNFCPPNASLNRQTIQSSTAHTGSAEKAVDGNKDGIFWDGSSGLCTHTMKEQDPWWRVTLDNSCFISQIEIANRIDCCSERLQNFEIRVGDNSDNNGADNPKCGEFHNVGKETKRITCDPPLKGMYLYIRIPGQIQILTLCEVTVNP